MMERTKIQKREIANYTSVENLIDDLAVTMNGKYQAKHKLENHQCMFDEETVSIRKIGYFKGKPCVSIEVNLNCIYNTSPKYFNSIKRFMDKYLNQKGKFINESKSKVIYMMYIDKALFKKALPVLTINYVDDKLIQTDEYGVIINFKMTETIKVPDTEHNEAIKASCEF